MIVPSVLGQFRNSPVASVGGLVVALLLKAKQKKATKLPSTSGINNTLKEYDMGGIIPCHARLQEQYTYESEMTQFAVESGASLNDHVIVRPIRLDLVFEVCNIPDKSRAQSIHDMLVDMWQSRTKVDLLTEHAVLQNMVCVSLRATNEAPEWGKLSFRSVFQQARFVNLQAAKFSEEKAAATSKTSGKSQPKRATATKNGGSKPAKSVAVKGSGSLSLFKELNGIK